tara:strand:+ start:3059 stop:3175 length:117 start_codon:yes stop_codon:yes gene_type:complete
MPNFIFYLVIIITCLCVTGCGVKSSPFLTEKTNQFKDE